MKNTTIKSYSVRGLKISKELKRLSEGVQTTHVKYYFKQIHNPQASKCTTNLTTSRVMSSFMN